MSEPPLKIGDKWKLMAASTIAKLRLSSSLGMNVTISTEGCASLAKILEAMAEKLDIAEAMFDAMEERD